MPYTNISCASTIPIRNYIDLNWVHSDQTNFLKKQILTRAVYLILVPSSVITSALDIIIGLGTSIAAFCTIGKHLPTYKITVFHLSSSNKLVVRPYIHLLQTINPKAEWGNLNESEEIKLFAKSRNLKPPMISSGEDGFTSDPVINSLKSKSKEYRNSKNFLKRHVSSRLTIALLAVSCLVTRAIDGILSIPATALSILTMGNFMSLNNLSYNTLQATGIISDLFYCTTKFINPWAGLVTAE